MDGSTVEHSDSDSGESWTLLENNITYADEAPDFPENADTPIERENVETPQSDKDDDTDGISIISDSDHESTPCDKCEELCPTEQTPLLPSTPTPNRDPITSQETDFLGDNIKYKTYVHKRNPKVGTILDIIMLGTFVITAGMALGHLWSCKNECTTQTSINKILSNLYKLQEENAFLRNKLKEVTLATGYQIPAHKLATEKIKTKQHRCKKVFEEPLIKNRKIETGIKCLDEKPNVPRELPIPPHEKEFLNDLNKIKNIYDENKVWLDIEVKKQFDKLAEGSSDGSTTKVSDTVTTHKQINLKKQLETKRTLPHDHKDASAVQHSANIANDSQIKQFGPELEISFTSDKLESSDDTGGKTESNESIVHISIEGIEENLPSKDKKITYADSLKTDQPLKRIKRSENIPSRFNREHIVKRKHKDDDILLNLNSFSEDDIKKDDRYIGPKMKHDKKKHDHQKSHKKHKRNNKYEQWEMKGGYLRDYDELSATSLQDNNNNFIFNPDKKFLNHDFENYINKLVIENNASNKDEPKTTKKFEEKVKGGKRSLKNDKGKKMKGKEAEWFDKRSALRAEARMKLEHELFGENTSNNAGWYFRRMQKREQCRAQKDNSTFKKFSKRKMNFKMKR